MTEYGWLVVVAIVAVVVVITNIGNDIVDGIRNKTEAERTRAATEARLASEKIRGAEWHRAYIDRKRQEQESDQ